ncbi:hypothetical protein SNE40_016645 [Patella caerulea]|uniref:Methyltransferase type 11 domain-containing protein n=1 Tax=Patella caerulea TaxID=87958 RepID=A0AAN8PCK0_PATCE
MAVQDFEVKTIFFYYLFPVIALLLLLRVLKYLKPRLLACGCNAIETFVLCSVRNTEKVLQEVKRVLKPGGKFFFMDHVAAEHSSSLRWFQNRLNPLWKAAADDCHINREIASTINKIGFSSVEVNQFNLNTFIVLIKPSIYGTSVK